MTHQEQSPAGGPEEAHAAEVVAALCFKALLGRSTVISPSMVEKVIGSEEPEATEARQEDITTHIVGVSALDVEDESKLLADLSPKQAVLAGVLAALKLLKDGLPKAMINSYEGALEDTIGSEHPGVTADILARQPEEGYFVGAADGLGFYLSVRPQTASPSPETT